MIMPQTELSVELTNIRNVSHNVGPATVIVEREQSAIDASYMTARVQGKKIMRPLLVIQSG